MRDQAIVVGDKGKGGRRSGPLARRLRAIALLVVAAGGVAWSMESVDEESRVRQALLDISRLSHASRLFRADHGRCPASVDELAAPPSGPAYVERVDDPWGQRYRLVCPARNDPGGVDVMSLGADGSASGEDNISSL